MRTIIVVFAALTLYSCGSASAPAVVPGGGGTQIYELMEDSTEVKADSAVVAPAH